jgi:nucleotide-binding universal stress UspA family protein
MGGFDKRQILVAVDGSDAAWAALRAALELGTALGCTITAVTAIQTRMPGYRAGYFSFVDRHILDELRTQAGAVLQDARRRAAEKNAELETQTLEGEGEIYTQLVELLGRTEGICFLVMGSYGHGLRDRHLLGSTTQRIIVEIARRELKVPVLVVPS